MYYSKNEEYRFSMPQEHKAYLMFKEHLEDAGVKFRDHDHGMFSTIEINEHGRFEVDSDGNFSFEGR